VPTTFVGLVIFVAFLTPGFLHFAQRRALAPRGERSTLIETTSVVSISLATNAVATALFGVARWRLPEHTPDIGALFRAGSTYWLDHLPYVLSWVSLVLVFSCVLAVVVARVERVRRFVNKLWPPVIIESSAWCETFAANEGDYPHAGIELADGTFASGRVVWYSTDLEETGDRDLVLGPPLQIRTAEGATDLNVQRVIVAARDIRRIDVTYIAESETNPAA
jgi:O-antigen/teichoic acid export membrane protein